MHNRMHLELVVKRDATTLYFYHNFSQLISEMQVSVISGSYKITFWFALGKLVSAEILCTDLDRRGN
jgi:hypothetical protein